MARMGHLHAALRVAWNWGCGPAFACVLCEQACHFEAHGTIKPTRQGKKNRAESMLDDEALQMGIQRWLRTLEVGMVSYLSHL